tara:strand:- start:932 stop:1624 length:693 start_codon:yes stop_codon:yes gene_type:complete
MKKDKKTIASPKTKWYDISDLDLGKIAREGMDLENNGRMLQKIAGASEIHKLSNIQIESLKESALYLLDLSDGSRGFMASQVLKKFPELEKFEGLEYAKDFSSVKAVINSDDKPSSLKYDLDTQRVSRAQETQIKKIITDEIIELAGAKKGDSFTSIIDRVMLSINEGNHKLIKSLSELMADSFTKAEPEAMKGYDRNVLLTNAVDFLKDWAGKHLSKRMGVSGLGKAEA